MKEKIIVLDIGFEYEGNIQHIFPTVLIDEKNIVLVDCGYEESIDILIEKLKENEISPDKITAIYLTHQDDDHMGAAFELKKRYPKIKIITSETEEKYISGQEKNLRLKQAEEMLKILPKEQKEFGEAFLKRMQRLKSVQVDSVVKDGSMLNWCSQCKVIDTKGHTQGQTSLYLLKYDTVITGDAAVLENGELKVANPQFCYDKEEAKKSLEKLKSLNADRYICYHGGIFENHK